MKYNIITIKQEKVWQGEARAVHISWAEHKHRRNFIRFINAFTYDYPEPYTLITICLDSIPAQVLMDSGSNFWLGEYESLPADQVLWKFKPKQQIIEQHKRSKEQEAVFVGV